MQKNPGITRSEIIRTAIRDLLVKELRELEDLPHVDLLFDLPTKYEAYHSCFICDQPLDASKEPYFHKKIKIIEFRPCCYCLKKYQGKSLEEFPDTVKKSIEERIKNLK